MDTRYKVVFENEEALDAAIAAETDPSAIKVVNRKRHSIAVQQPHAEPEIMFANRLDGFERRFAGRVVEDYRYDLEDEASPAPDFLVESVEATEASLNEVLEAIRATSVWPRTRGQGVTIAVVDTGVDGTRPEFPQSKRVGSWQPEGDTPWTDWEGHGTMCACIAAGTRADGGLFDGVAPDAGLIACKTSFFDTELGAIYDFLTERAAAGEVIVATNSFGQRRGTPPEPPAHSDFIPALDDAIAAGIRVFFSAGNNHQLASGAPTACTPNSIWLHKSRADVMAVATCDLEQAMWFYSSRGPGQFFGEPGTNEKPDVTAPTPRNGRVVYGGGVQTLANGWGTSGACPQVAGLAALLLALDPSMSRHDLFARIRESAQNVGHGPMCQGGGMIDCEAAAASLLTG
jgi:serine protease AprX